MLRSFLLKVVLFFVAIFFHSFALTNEHWDIIMRLNITSPLPSDACDSIAGNWVQGSNPELVTAFGSNSLFLSRENEGVTLCDPGFYGRRYHPHALLKKSGDIIFLTGDSIGGIEKKGYFFEYIIPSPDLRVGYVFNAYDTVRGFCFLYAVSKDENMLATFDSIEDDYQSKEAGVYIYKKGVGDSWELDDSAYKNLVSVDYSGPLAFFNNPNYLVIGKRGGQIAICENKDGVWSSKDFVVERSFGPEDFWGDANFEPSDDDKYLYIGNPVGSSKYPGGVIYVFSMEKGEVVDEMGSISQDQLFGWRLKSIPNRSTLSFAFGVPEGGNNGDGSFNICEYDLEKGISCNGWSMPVKDPGSDKAGFGEFFDISPDSYNLAIGAPGYNNSVGTVFAYQYAPGKCLDQANWCSLPMIFVLKDEPEPTEGAEFGFSLDFSLDSTELWIGAQGDSFFSTYDCRGAVFWAHLVTD